MSLTFVVSFFRIFIWKTFYKLLLYTIPLNSFGILVYNAGDRLDFSRNGKSISLEYSYGRFRNNFFVCTLYNSFRIFPSKISISNLESICS